MQELEFAPEATVPFGLGKHLKAAFADFDGDGMPELLVSCNSFQADTMEMRSTSLWTAKISHWTDGLPTLFRPHRFTSPRPYSIQALRSTGPRAELLVYEGNEVGIYENAAFDASIRFQIRRPLLQIDKEMRAGFRGDVMAIQMLHGDADHPGDLMLTARDLSSYYPPVTQQQVTGLPFGEVMDKSYDANGQWRGGSIIQRLYRFRADAGGEGVYGPPEQVLDAAGNALELPGGMVFGIADLDCDGDSDLLYGLDNWHLGYLEDIGTPGEPQWVDRGAVQDLSGQRMRFGYSYLYPLLVNWNQRPGIVLTSGGGYMFHCSFEGMRQGVPILGEPVEIQQTGGGGMGRDGFLTPSAVDLDQNGSYDIISGCEKGRIMVFRNAGTPGQPRFVGLEHLKDVEGNQIRQWPAKDGRGDIQGPAEDEWGYTGVTVGDWCGNGLLDIIAADSMGEFHLYRNCGNATEPRYAPGKPLTHNGKVFRTVWRQRPWIVDFDGDGIAELAAMDPYGHARLYRCVEGDPYQIDMGTLLPREDGQPLKLDGLRMAPGSWQGRTNLCVVDLDGDRKLDILIGWGAGYQESRSSHECLSRFRFATVKWFRNVGSNTHPKFREGGYLRHGGWPIVAGGHNCAVHAVDWDRDGKLELIFGTDNGQLCVLDHDEFSFDVP